MASLNRCVKRTLFRRLFPTEKKKDINSVSSCQVRIPNAEVVRLLIAAIHPHKTGWNSGSVCV